MEPDRTPRDRMLLVFANEPGASAAVSRLEVTTGVDHVTVDSPMDRAELGRLEQQDEGANAWFGFGAGNEEHARGSVYWTIIGTVAGFVVGFIIGLFITAQGWPRISWGFLIGLIGALAGSTSGFIWGISRRPDLDHQSESRLKYQVVGADIPGDSEVFERRILPVIRALAPIAAYRVDLIEPERLERRRREEWRA